MPDYTNELPDPEEYEGARRKLEFLASSHGQGYTFSRGNHTTVKHDDEGAFGDNEIIMHSPSGEWAGSITHDQDGNVGHFYVKQPHRAAVPALLTEAVRQAKNLGFVPPHPDGHMSPRAYKLATRLLPNNSRNARNTGEDLTNYGD
jgi:hypothetical protein